MDYIDDYLFNEELVLLGEDGAPFFDQLRDVAFLVREPVWVNNHIHVLRPGQLVRGDYLRDVLNAVDYVAYISGSTRDKLTQSEMAGIRVPLPSLDEQRRISERCDSPRSGCRCNCSRRLSALLRERRRALITACVTGEFDVSTASPRAGDAALAGARL